MADHYAGTFADVLRLAVPPRHAATEQAEPRPPVPLVDADRPAGPLADYPTGPGFLHALRDGRSAAGALAGDAERDRRAATGPPGWPSAARACAESGRGAVIVVPDQRDLERLRAACTAAARRRPASPC